MKQTSIKKNFAMNVILTMSSFIFPLITFPYVSRILLPEGTGKVAFATSIITYFNMFAQLGIPTYGIRACAQCRDDRDKLSQVTKELLTINLIFGVISTAALVVSVFLIPRFYADRTLFLIMGITIILNAVGMNWLFQGLEQYSWITMQSVVFKAAALVAMFLLVHQKSDYVIYGGITIFASSASNIMNFFYSRKFISLTKHRINPWKHLKPVFVFFAMSVATTIYTNLDAVMLGFMAGDVDVGYYNAAVKIKTILVSLVTSLGAVLLPRASYYIKNHEVDEFRRISTKALNFVFIVASPLMLYFMCFAEEGIYFLSGSAYAGSILPMQIIMPTLLFIGLSNILGLQILVPLGKEKMVLYSEIAGALTDLVLNALLIPHYRSSGAAVGTVVAEFVVLAVQYGFLGRLVSPMFCSISYGKILAALAAGTLASLWVKGLALSPFATLVISAVLFFGVYFIMLLILKDSFAYYLLDQVKSIVHKKSRRAGKEAE